MHYNFTQNIFMDQKNIQEKKFTLPKLSRTEPQISKKNQKKISFDSPSSLSSKTNNYPLNSFSLETSTSTSIDEGFEDLSLSSIFDEFNNNASIENLPQNTPRTSTPQTPTKRPNWQRLKKENSFSFYGSEAVKMPVMDDKVGGKYVSFILDPKYLKVAEGTTLPLIIKNFETEHPKQQQEVEELTNCLNTAIKWANQAKEYFKKDEDINIDQMAKKILEYHNLLQILIHHDLEESKKIAALKLHSTIRQRDLMQQQNVDPLELEKLQKNILNYRRQNSTIDIELSSLRTSSKILRLLYKAITGKLITKENEDNSHPQNTYLHALKNKRNVLEGGSKEIQKKIYNYEHNIPLPKPQIPTKLSVPNIYDTLTTYFGNVNYVLNAEFPFTSKIKDALLRHSSLQDTTRKLYLTEEILKPQNETNNQPLDWSREHRKILIPLNELPKSSNLLSKRKDMQKNSPK